jgi:hypothetical protein
MLCLLLTPLQAQDLSITLLNGDCDGDNEVTLYDFGILSSALGSFPGDPNWDPRADLDGGLEVTLYDLAILQRNFGAIGAQPFDAALPRQPALQSGGYELQGVVQLEGWQGDSKRVRIEALLILTLTGGFYLLIMTGMATGCRMSMRNEYNLSTTRILTTAVRC